MKGLIFTYAVTYGGAVVSFFNPWYGLLIYFMFSIIKPESMWYWSVPKGNYSRIVAVCLLFGWLFQGCGDWKIGKAKPIAASFIMFLVWAFFSAQIKGSDWNVSFDFLESMFKILLPFLVGLSLLNSIDRLKQLCWVIVLSQGFVAYEMNLSYYFGSNRLILNGFGGMDNNSVSIAMVTSAGLAFFLGISQEVWWRKLICFACAGLMVHTPMFAGSRGGMLGLVVVAAVTFYLLPKTPSYYFTFALGIIMGLALAGPSVIERFSSVFVDKQERDKSANSRVEMWKDCMDSMQKNPLFGVGPNHWPLVAPLYGYKRGKEAHSVWFQTGAELGYPGLLFLLSFYGVTCFRLLQIVRRSFYWEKIDPMIVNLSRMVLASIAGFVVSGSFVSLEGLELPYYIVLIGAGVLKIIYQYERTGSVEVVEPSIEARAYAYA